MGSKKEPHEIARETVERITQETLDMEDCKISFELQVAVVFEKDEDSLSFTYANYESYGITKMPTNLTPFVKLSPYV